MRTISSCKKPRLAIIGCGAVVEHQYLPALRQQDWTPSVLVDRSSSQIAILSGFARRRRLEIVTASDWTEVADQFDAAIVATPNATHGPIGLSLLKAGKHILVVNPFVTSSGQGLDMIEAAKTVNRVLAVGLRRRYLQTPAWTRALVQSGVLGSIVSFHARESPALNWTASTDAVLRHDLSGGGVLINTGTHTLDILTQIFGNIRPISYQDDGESGVEANCVAVFILPGGGKGRLELSSTRTLTNSVYIEGTNGFIEVALDRDEVLAGSTNALNFCCDGITPLELQQKSTVSLIDIEIENFFSSVKGDDFAACIDGAEGLRSTFLIERCYSMRQPLLFPWQCAQPLPALQIKAGAKVVITGASGFIGGRLAERVMLAGADVSCLIRHIPNATRLARLPLKLLRTDLTIASEVHEALKGADYVFHCAYDPASRKQNLEAVRNLITACCEHKVSRFVYLSSFSVYEPFPPGLLTEKCCDGDRSWAYVKTKLDIEREVLLAARERGIAATIVQPTVVYGPFSKPWTDLIAEMLIYRSVILPDKGEGLCNAVFIDDLVDGLMLAATQNAAIGERFILSGAETVSWARFFTAFAQALDVPAPCFLPAKRIRELNSGFLRDIKMVIRSPKRLIQILVRWNAVRYALEVGLAAMPQPLRNVINRNYFGGNRIYKAGEPVLPDPQKLSLYCSQAITNSEKARNMLGYSPSYTFNAGMNVTRPYLKWAYGDARRFAYRSSLKAHTNPYYDSLVDETLVEVSDQV